VEAAYRFEPPDDAWLKGVIESVAPVVDQGFGVWSFTFDTHAFTRGNLDYRIPTAVGLPPNWLEGLKHTLSITTRDSRAMFELMFGAPCHTMSAILRKHAKKLARVEGAIGLPGVHDAIGITARDTAGWAVFIGAHAPRVFDLDARQTARFSRIAAHIATAHRLRRRVRKADAVPEDELERRAEAIVGARGKVIHATGSATANAALATLKQAAIAVDDAARTLRDKDPDEALRAWEGLVRGRWSLVSSFDDKGRRIFLAEPNEPVAPKLEAELSRRERQIAGYLLLGHSDKLIAYELGLSEGAISAVVSRLKKKLATPTMAALLRALAALSRRGLLEGARPKKR